MMATIFLHPFKFILDHCCFRKLADCLHFEHYSCEYDSMILNKVSSYFLFSIGNIPSQYFSIFRMELSFEAKMKYHIQAMAVEKLLTRYFE